MTCARCRRPLSRPPIVVEGRGYGPTCAAMLGDLLTPAKPQTVPGRRRARRGNERQLALEVQP